MELFEAIIGLVSGFLATAFFITTGAVIWKRNWMEPKIKPITFSFKNISQEFVDEVVNLHQVINKNREIDNKKVVNQLNAILKETKVLFEAINETGNNAKLIEASVNYADKFKKLSVVFGENIYLKAKKTPQYFDDPEKIIKRSESVLKPLYQQIIENIKQINRHGDLDFKVALEALVSKEESDLDNVFESAKSSEGYKTI